MFQRKPDESQVQLAETIRQVEADMQTMEGGSEEHTKALTSLERLYKLKEKNSPKGLDPNTLILVGGNILGILIIVTHERAAVITTKALSFAGKLK